MLFSFKRIVRLLTPDESEVEILAFEEHIKSLNKLFAHTICDGNIRRITFRMNRQTFRLFAHIHNRFSLFILPKSTTICNIYNRLLESFNY